MNNRYFLLVVLLVAACSKSNNSEPESQINAVSFSVTIDENPINDQVLGSIQANSDAGDVTFSISSSNPSGAFAINESSGELTVADKYLFDYETSPTLSASIAITDGISSVSIEAEVTLNDLEFVWTGPKKTFYKPASVDTNLETYQDRLTENVWLTRENSGALVNKVTGAIGCAPGNVKMAYGKVADRASLVFSDCMEKLEGSKLNELPGKDVVFYLVADDIYLDVHFISWSSGSSGGEYSYERTTPN